mmetsp:Transcript_45315/g.145278  ORF Transcript_45315/g.145278 Transcript_45315/m.145278 type:complete len:752 (-) Transcript_45315:411-2666(-)
MYRQSAPDSAVGGRPEGRADVVVAGLCGPMATADPDPVPRVQDLLALPMVVVHHLFVFDSVAPLLVRLRVQHRDPRQLDGSGRLVHALQHECFARGHLLNVSLQVVFLFEIQKLIHAPRVTVHHLNDVGPEHDPPEPRRHQILPRTLQLIHLGGVVGQEHRPGAASAGPGGHCGVFWQRHGSSATPLHRYALAELPGSAPLVAVPHDHRFSLVRRIGGHCGGGAVDVLVGRLPAQFSRHLQAFPRRHGLVPDHMVVTSHDGDSLRRWAAVHAEGLIGGGASLRGEVVEQSLGAGLTLQQVAPSGPLKLPDLRQVGADQIGQTEFLPLCRHLLQSPLDPLVGRDAHCRMHIPGVGAEGHAKLDDVLVEIPSSPEGYLLEVVPLDQLTGPHHLRTMSPLDLFHLGLLHEAATKCDDEEPHAPLRGSNDLLLVARCLLLLLQLPLLLLRRPALGPGAEGLLREPAMQLCRGLLLRPPLLPQHAGLLLQRGPLQEVDISAVLGSEVLVLTTARSAQPPLLVLLGRAHVGLQLHRVLPQLCQPLLHAPPHGAGARARSLLLGPPCNAAQLPGASLHEPDHEQRHRKLPGLRLVPEGELTCVVALAVVVLLRRPDARYERGIHRRKLCAPRASDAERDLRDPRWQGDDIVAHLLRAQLQVYQLTHAQGSRLHSPLAGGVPKDRGLDALEELGEAEVAGVRVLLHEQLIRLRGLRRMQLRSRHPVGEDLQSVVRPLAHRGPRHQRRDALAGGRGAWPA